MKKHRIGALVAAAALTLTFAGTALATTGQWGGNGYPSNSCSADTTGNMLWIWTGGSPTSLTINGHEYTGWEQQGQGSYHLTIDIDPGTNYPPVEGADTFVTYSGSAGTLTLSGCNESTVTTTTSSETTQETTSETTSETTQETTSETTQSTTTDEITTSSSTTSSGTEPGITPPHTDTLASAASGTVSTGLLLILAGILAAALVVIPAAARSRR